ncbi:hypothetical protein MKX03_036234, partial [Papaver bracteatum]
PSNTKYSDVEISSKSSDLCTTTVQNLSSNIITVDGNVLAKNEKDLRILFHAKCYICLNIWHDVVTAAPCLHNFCNGCFSEWLRRSIEKHPRVLCPQCRGTVQFVGRNHFLPNIEEEILQDDSSLRRSSDEIALLNKCATIKSNLVILAVVLNFCNGAYRGTSIDFTFKYSFFCFFFYTSFPQCGNSLYFDKMHYVRSTGRSTNYLSKWLFLFFLWKINLQHL